MEEINYYDKYDIAKLMGCSVSKAYNIIKGIKLAYCKKHSIPKEVSKEIFVAGKINKDIYHEILKNN